MIMLMSKKTLSLKEFYENHGSSKVSTYNNSLPVRPRCDRDDDQGLHLRLAQNCLLDSGKAYPQRHGLVKEGPFSEVGGYGKHGGSSDGAPVGDVDYYRPTGPHHSSGPNSGYYTHRQGPHGPSGPHDRPAQQGYELTGSYPQHRGPVSPSGMPAAGGPAGAGGMGGPMHHGGMHGSYAAGPGYGRPPQYAYGPQPGSFGPPPQHAYPAPQAGGVPGLQHGPAVVAGCGESRPPVLPPSMAFGPATYGPPAGPYGVPPPPPPPRHLPAQQQPVSDAPTAQITTIDSTARAGDSRHTVRVQPVLAAPAAATRPANAEAISKVVRESANKPALAAASERATPFAAANGGTRAVVEPAAPVGPKNEFAERLAQRAMASVARAKSNLLAGGSSGSLSRDGSLAHGSAQGTAFNPVDIPAAPTAAPDADSNGSSPSDQQGVFVRPAHPFGRPKLALKPRGAPLDRPAQGSGNYSSTSSDSGDTPAERGSSSASSSVSSGRPRLHLLPRGSSLSADSSSGVSTAAAASTRKASVFGEAKPREEVLKGRGLDPSLVDCAMDRGCKPSEITGRQGSFGDKGSRLAATHSGSDDGWHTVAGHGRKGTTAERDGKLLPEFDGFDPFFGSGSTKASSGYVAVPPAGTFMRDGGSRRCGVYGSPNGRGGGFGVSVGDEDEDDAAVFRRALPTRQLPLAL